jgi:choline dehydrogenase-like flavoprotein
MSSTTAPNRSTCSASRLGGGLQMMKEIGRYRRERTGMMTSNGAEGGGFLRRFPDSPAPEFQLHFVVGMIDSHARKLHLGHGYSCHICLLRPKSVGTLALASADPWRRRASIRISSAMPTTSTPWSMASSSPAS